MPTGVPFTAAQGGADGVLRQSLCRVPRERCPRGLAGLCELCVPWARQGQWHSVLAVPAWQHP